MSNKNRPSTLNLKQIRIQQPTDNPLLTECPSPNTISARRRKKQSSHRTNEELIKQSHNQLLGYMDTVDDRVQDIIRTFEVQFLGAYQEHIRRVRGEMEDIKRRSLNSASSQNAYLDKIETMEKQLIIFREESLRLFDKLAKKDKQVSLLSIRLTELEATIKQQERHIYLLTKQNKKSEVAIELTKQQRINSNQEIAQERPKRFSRSENKLYKDSSSSPISKQFILEQGQLRPCSTQIRSQPKKNMSLKIQSQLKQQTSREHKDMSWIKLRIEEKIGNSSLVPIDTVLDIIEEKTRQNERQTKRDTSSSFRKARNSYMVKMQAKRSNFNFLDQEVKMKSKNMADTSQLKEVFRNCIEQVRKEVVRRNNAPTLNFFKDSGFKNYLEFRKIDCFSILQLLLSNQSILKALHSLIFNSP